MLTELTLPQSRFKSVLRDELNVIKTNVDLVVSGRPIIPQDLKTEWGIRVRARSHRHPHLAVLPALVARPLQHRGEAVERLAAPRRDNVDVGGLGRVAAEKLPAIVEKIVGKDVVFVV